MADFDEIQAIGLVPVGRDILWSHTSLGVNEAVFDDIHRRFERLEGAGQLRILSADRESHTGKRLVVRMVFQRLA